jgi:hypothetical protein
MHQGYPNPQAPQQSDIEQQVAKIVILDHRAVQSDDKNFVAELRNVAKNFSQIGQAEHFVLGPRSLSFVFGDVEYILLLVFASLL